MKFLYEYRTTDNAKHKGVVCASNRDAAYAELKRQGVRPSRLVEAPGFFNKLFGKGKRWIAIGALATVAVAAVIAARQFKQEAASVKSGFESSMRRQVIGDAAVIEKGIRTGWADVFELEGDRFLASFAIPGYPPAIRSTTTERIEESLRSKTRARGDSSASLEARQMLAIVEGMKDELRRFLANKGTIAEYGQCLVARQEQEIDYYNRAKNEVEVAIESEMPQSDIITLWDDRNDKLRKMGIRTIPYPNEE